MKQRKVIIVNCWLCTQLFASKVKLFHDLRDRKQKGKKVLHKMNLSGKVRHKSTHCKSGGLIAL